MCVAASISCHPPAACVCECSLCSRAALGQSPGSSPDSLLLTSHKHASDKKDSCIHLGKKRGSTRAPGSKSRSCFMGMKCPACRKFPVVFSHAQHIFGSVLLHSALLHQPTAAGAGLMERCSIRQKQHYLNEVECVLEGE